MKTPTYLLLLHLISREAWKVAALLVPMTEEIRLHHDLFNNSGYDPSALPRKDGDDKPIKVLLGMTLNQLVDIATADGEITINAFIRQKWNISVLNWDPAKYGGIKVINVRPQQVWVPDIHLYDNVQDDKNYNGFLDTLKTRIKLNHTGGCQWMSPIMLRASCSIDVAKFPFDTQTCPFRFGIWTHDTEKVLLEPEEPRAVIPSDFTENVQWRLLSMNSFVEKRKYECCPEPFNDVTFKVVARRKPLFLFVNLIAPNIIFSFMTILVYVLPTDSGEKCGYVVNLFLAMALFLTSSINLIPDSSEAIPLYGYFLGLILIAMLLLTITMCYSLTIHFACDKVSRMPSWMRRYLLNQLAPFMGVKIRIEPLDWRKIVQDVQKVIPSVVNSTLACCHPGRLWNLEEIMEGESEGGEDLWQVHGERCFRRKSFDNRLLRDFSDKLDIVINSMQEEEQRAYRKAEWRAVSKALDKFCFWFFTCSFLLIVTFCAFKGAPD